MYDAFMGDRMDISYLIARLIGLLPEYVRKYTHAAVFYLSGVFLLWGAGYSESNPLSSAGLMFGIGVLLVTVALVIFFEGRDTSRWAVRIGLAVMILLPIASLAIGAAPGIIQENERQQKVEAQRQAQYNKAKAWKNSGYYTEAIKVLSQMEGGAYLYREEIEACENLAKYDRAEKLFAGGAYEQAAEAFRALGDFRDSRDKAAQCDQIHLEPVYQQAAEAMAQGRYDQAYKLFIGIRSYRDVAQLLQTEEMQKGRDEFYSAGCQLTLGTYDQKDIQWRIRAREGNRALLITQDILEFQPYAYEDNSNAWETSFLRTWLNETFLQDAFDEAELACICYADVSGELSVPETEESENPESAVIDRVFIFSDREAQRYYKDDAARVAYANLSGGRRSKEHWCLRTPGSEPGYITIIDHSGSNEYMVPVDNLQGVRPAMWIELNDEILWQQAD